MPTSATGIAREHLEAFLAALSDRLSPATVAKHDRSLQQLFRWLVEDGEIGHSPMERMRPPAVPEQPSTSSPTTSCGRCSTPPMATPSDPLGNSVSRRGGLHGHGPRPGQPEEVGPPRVLGPTGSLAGIEYPVGVYFRVRTG
jgi:hypothetical protein